MVKTAKNLKAQKGILAIPAQKIGKRLPSEISIRVQQFYEEDEFSRMCPGKKDCVPVRIDGQKVYKQKRLLLCNLKEMYTAYKMRYGPEVGFSKFCELRPKWCVTVGVAGSHSVCVCTYHQNVKLMLAGTDIQENYKTLSGKCVCDMESKDCMLKLR